jgi:GntR family transcriptional regulator
MDLRLNRKSQLPLHVQLKAQLTHLIRAGQLAPGAQLPTVRQLAGFLRINRNTVAKVFAELAREGYLSSEFGRGTFVSRSQVSAEKTAVKMRALSALVDEAIHKAGRLGFSPEELSTALFVRTQTSMEPVHGRKVPVLFVECNRPQLKRFRAQLQASLPLKITPLLVDELARKVQHSPAFFQRYALVVTTFFHVHETQKLLAKTAIEAVGLLAEASLETLMRLTALTEGTKVGVACNEWIGTENVKLSIQNAGLTHIHLIPGCGRDPKSLRQMLNEVSIVVCSSLVAAKIRAMSPRGTEILVDDRRLDQAGIEMLRQRLDTLQATDADGRA